MPPTLAEIRSRSCLPRGCAAYTPCLVKDSYAAPITVFTFCAGLDRQSVNEQMMAAYNKPAHHCLKDNEALAKKGESNIGPLKESGATLRITGPVSDGFWVRALVVMSQTAWARRLGLPVSISYRSQYDAYLDSHDERRDGWTQFFEPLKRNLTGGERKRLLSNPIGHANILGKQCPE